MPVVSTSTNGFDGASPDNPVAEFHVFPLETVVTVELSVNGEYYAVQAQDVLPITTCPPATSSRDDAIVINNDSAARSITLQGTIDTVIVLCTENVVVARSYYIFEGLPPEDEEDVS